MATFLLALVNLALGAGKGPCGKLQARANDGSIRLVDLSELWQMSLTTPFSVVDSVAQWTYEFGVCADIPCGQQKGAACQETTQPSFYPLGKYSEPIQAVYSKNSPLGAIVFPIQQAGDPPRGSIITIYCDPAALQPRNFSVISAPLGSQPPYMYKLGLSHRSACGQVPVPASPGLCHNLVAHGPHGETRTVNLDELSSITNEMPFMATDEGTGIQYEFGVCQNIPCTQQGTPAAGCATTPAPFSYSLGPYPNQMTANLTLEGYVNGAIQLNIPQFGFQHMLLTIICDYNAVTPANVFAISPKEGSPPPWTYQMFVTHRSACGV
jgi:hypothetical protein